jgi:short-subunit dehydrogenase
MHIAEKTVLITGANRGIGQTLEIPKYQGTLG